MDSFCVYTNFKKIHLKFCSPFFCLIEMTVGQACFYKNAVDSAITYLWYLMILKSVFLEKVLFTGGQGCNDMLLPTL